MLAHAPLALYIVPKVHAHLSAFSWPLESYQAFNCGSVEDSSSSCAITDTMPSAAASPLGLVDCAAHAPRFAAALPTKAYLIGVLLGP